MSRFLWSLMVLISHWRRHKMQLVTLLIGLISATALWSGVQAINTQARLSYDRAAASFGGGHTPMLVPVGAATLPQELYVRLRRADVPVSPVLEGRITLNGTNLRLIGVEPLTVPPDAGPAPGGGVTFSMQDVAAFLLPPGQARLAPSTLKELGLLEKDTPLLGDGQKLPPLALQHQLAHGVVVVDIGVAQRLLKQQGRLSRLLLDAGYQDRATIEKVSGGALRLIMPDGETDLDRLTSSFHINLTAFGLLSFVVGLFIVHSAIGLAFEQRLPVMRTMRACGISARGLTVAMLAELVAFALLAGLLGCLCGYAIAAMLLPDVAASLRGLYGAQVPGQLTLDPWWWGASMAMSLAGTLAAAAYSLFKIGSLPLLVSAQPQAWRQAQQRWLKWQALAALGILAMSALVLLAGDGLIAGFALLASLMLGAALLLPVLLDICLRIGEFFARGMLAKWFWADSRQQLSGLSLALMALLLALAVNIGVGTMVKSFSRSFAGWLDQRLSAEIYINAADETQAQAIRNFLKSRDEVRAILPTPRADTRIDGAPVEVLGFADHATYHASWPLIAATPSLWDDVREGKGMLVSEQLARRLGLALGETREIMTAKGAVRLQVAGIYPDYGNPKGQIGIANDLLFAQWPDAPRTRFSLRVEPDKVSALIGALRQTFPLDPSRLIDQAELKADSTRIFNRTFAVTASLNAFTLGVAGIALLTSLLTLGNSRLPQLAPLWAIGMTRQRLAMLELAKTMALAFFTALLAVPLGLLVAWCLLAVVNVKAFGWRLPFHVFPDQLLQLIAVAMVAALLATLLPMIKLMRMTPAGLIRIFANER